MRHKGFIDSPLIYWSSFRHLYEAAFSKYLSVSLRISENVQRTGPFKMNSRKTWMCCLTAVLEAIFFSAVMYTDWKNPKLLSDIYPQSQYSDLFKCNTEFLYPFSHCLHEHFVTLYYRSARGWGFCWWRKIKFGFCTKTAHAFTGLQTSDFFQVLCNSGLSIAPDGSW